MKYLIWILSVSIFMFSCGPSQKLKKEEPAEKTRTSGYDESFDPLSLDDDDIVIEPTQKRTVTKPAEQSRPRQDAVIEQQMDGWRVQIFVSNNFETATVKQEQAKIEFDLW